LKQGCALSLLLFNFTLEWGKSKKIKTLLNLRGAQEILIYTDVVTLLGGNIVTVRKKTALLDRIPFPSFYLSALSSFRPLPTFLQLPFVKNSGRNYRSKRADTRE
jgi:hypothetical protein